MEGYILRALEWGKVMHNASFRPLEGWLDAIDESPCGDPDRGE